MIKRETNLQVRRDSWVPIVCAFAGLLPILRADSTCMYTKWSATGCPNLHVWFYLPVGVFFSAVVLSVYRAIMPLAWGWRVGRSPGFSWPRPDISLQFGIIVAGYFAALSLRALDTPVIHHPYHVWPRFDVGLALLLLMLVPTSKSWPGAILALTSCALILNHWFG